MGCNLSFIKAISRKKGVAEVTGIFEETQMMSMNMDFNSPIKETKLEQLLGNSLKVDQSMKTQRDYKK